MTSRTCLRAIPFHQKSRPKVGAGCLSDRRPAGPASAGAVHRIFLDANVFFSAAHRAGAGIERLWRLGRSVTLISSAYAVEEARRNLQESARELLQALTKDLDVVADVRSGRFPSGVDLPEKDRPILLAAIAAGSTHLLTGDRSHLGPYFGQRIGEVLIERPGDHLRREHPTG